MSRSGRKKYVGRARPVRRRRSYRRRSYAKRVEFKYKDTSFVVLPTTTGGYYLVNSVDRGTDNTERIGRQITMKSLYVKGIMKYQASFPTAVVDQMVRLLIVIDKEPNGAVYTLDEVLTSIGVNTFRNLDNKSRFVILYDRKFNINTASEPGSFKQFKYFRRFNLPITYTGTGGSIADINKNSIYIWGCGTTATGSTTISVEGVARIRYTDD